MVDSQSRLKFLFTWILLSGMTTSGYSAVIPGRWEKVEALETGTDIIVLLHSGERQIGGFAGIDESVLYINTATSSDYSIHKVEVSKVIREESNSGTKGLLIGAGIGAASGALATSSYAGEAQKGPLIATSTGVCALIGFLVGRKGDTTEVLYRAKDSP